MPRLHFYAAHDDHVPIMRQVFESDEFRVFESNSKPDREIVEFKNAMQLQEHFGFESWLEAPTMYLKLLPLASEGLPTFCRINLKPGALGNATFRYSCEGWGLIQLYLQAPSKGCLPNSETNHFSPKAAKAWAEVDKKGKKSPSEWNWKEVQSASRRLNSFISRLAVEKIASMPILPIAHNLRAKGITFLPILG